MIKQEIVRDDYTGKPLEPVEDLSIIQEDGSRACYNWECTDEFYQLDYDEDPNAVGLADNDPAALFLQKHRSLKKRE